MRLRHLLAASLLVVAPARSEPVDPALITHADFTRHADPDHWAGLSVRRQGVTDGAIDWRLWRIANDAKPNGPLWVVPHDNENAAFSAGLAAVKRWGGVLIAVDSGSDDTTRAARYVHAHDGRRLDPNRTFTDAFPAYVKAVLADLGAPARPIIALHTNAAGFDGSLSTCGASPSTGGAGGVSVLLCNATYTPRPAPARSWPWDDDDSVVIAPYLAAATPGEGWCARRLTRGNFNLTFERVGEGDGSLSNYAAQRGLAYLNFETRDRGSDPAGIDAARDRLTAMIDAAMALCLTPDMRLVAAVGSANKAR